MNKEDRAKCPYKDCYKTFGCTLGLKHHLKKHNLNHLRRRPICAYQGSGKTFRSTQILRQHEKLHNPDCLPFRCPQCDYETYRKSDLKKHQDRMHNHNFYCQQCEV